MQSTTLRTLLTLRSGGGPGSWQTCAFLLEHMPQSADVVAATAPGSYLAYRLCRAVDPMRLFLHAVEGDPEDLRHPGQEAVPVLLGDRAYDRLPAFPRPWPALPVPPPTRTRPLDVLYADSHRIGLLVLDCGDRTPDVLRGAARVLSEHAPLLLIDFAGSPPAQRPALWEAYVAAAPGYEWYDGTLLLCPTADQRRTSALVPANTLACGLPSRAVIPDALPRGRGNALRPKEHALAALVRKTPPRMPPDVARQDGLTVAFDNLLPSTGLYPAETNRIDTWRSTGPGLRTVFGMPLPGPGQWRLSLQGLNWGTITSAGQLRLYADGVRLELEHAGPHTAVFGPLVVLAHHRGVARIELVVPEVHRASADDPRMLGINLTGCTLERL